MKFKIYYCIFLIICLFYPFLYVYEAISIRHIAAVVMIVWLIMIGEFKIDKFVKIFCIFLFFYGLSSIVTGFGSEYINKLFGTYLSCIAFYMSTKTMIIKYDSLKWVVYLILCIAIVDAIVTIGQFFNNPIARGVTLLLRVQNVDELLWEKYESGGGLMGVAAGGLLGDIENGYFLSAATILSLFNMKNGKIGIINWALFIFLFFALFATQERAGLGMGVLCCGTYIFINTKEYRSNIWIIALFVVFAVYFGGQYLSSIVDIDSTRYGLEGSDMGGRKELSSGAWSYILSNPLGGAFDFFAKGNREPHNFIANSFLYGGILGGLVVIAIIFSQLVRITKIIVKSFRSHKYSYSIVVFSLMYLAYTGNSAFHNLSLATGADMFFLLWGAIVGLSISETSKGELKTMKK